MATRGRFNKTLSGPYSPGATWAGNTFGVSASQMARQANMAASGAASGGASSSSGMNLANSTRTQRAQMGLTVQDQAKVSIMQEYDLPERSVDLLFDPSSMDDSNKASAAGGPDPKTARYPVLLRKPGDRLPTGFELRNQWAYQADREPIIGEGGETLDPNDTVSWDKFLREGYIPPRGSAAFNAMASAISSVGETFDETVQRMELTGSLGQPLQEYPTGFKPVTNKEAIPTAANIVYNPPAYKVVYGAGGEPSIEWSNTGADGNPSGYSVDATNATSPNNYPALQGNMIPDDPNFKPTPNPTYWILPNGSSTKSVPGSSDTAGFNSELWKFQTKPEEVGAKTTWDLAATNPQTGKIDPGLVSKETAAALSQYGNLPEEFKYLVNDSYSIYDQQVAPTAPPAAPVKPKDTTDTPPPPPKKTVVPPPKPPVAPPVAPRVPMKPISSTTKIAL